MAIKSDENSNLIRKNNVFLVDHDLIHCEKKFKLVWVQIKQRRAATAVFLQVQLFTLKNAYPNPSSFQKGVFVFKQKYHFVEE